MQSDIEDGLHPFIDPEQDDEITEKMEELLMLRLKKRKEAAAEGGEEAPEEEEGDEEKPKTMLQRVKDQIDKDFKEELNERSQYLEEGDEPVEIDEEEKALAKELADELNRYINEKR